jgi:hypothetical protein
MRMELGRVVAQKARIADVLAGNLEQAQGAPRVNIIGVVVSTGEGTPPSFMLDDRSAILLVRQFEHPVAPPVGAVVGVIGRVRDVSGERYVAAEIVRSLQAKWLEVRSLELGHQSSFITPTIPSTKPAPAAGVVEEQVVDDDQDSALLRAIGELDTGPGAAIDDILAKLGPDAETMIALLLTRGDIFEVSPGRVKILQ